MGSGWAAALQGMCLRQAACTQHDTCMAERQRKEAAHPATSHQPCSCTTGAHPREIFAHPSAHLQQPALGQPHLLLQEAAQLAQLLRSGERSHRRRKLSGQLAERRMQGRGRAFTAWLCTNSICDIAIWHAEIMMYFPSTRPLIPPAPCRLPTLRGRPWSALPNSSTRPLLPSSCTTRSPAQPW